MRFKVSKSSDWSYEGFVEFNTLEELLNFVEENGQVIVKSSSEIEIYDDYRE